MSDQGSSAPIQEAPAAPAESNESEMQELEALESEMEGQEESLEESKQEASSKEAPKAAPKAQEAKADKAAKQEGAKKIAEDKYTIKVDGQTVELSKEDMIKYAQLGKAGQQRMAEAAQIKKEAMELVSLLKSDPESILSDPAILGSREEVVKFAQKILAKQLEEETKSPELREKERLEKELEELRNKFKTEEERKRTEEYERLVADEERRLDEEITEAIDTSGLPKSPFVLKRIADVLLSAAENEKDISPKQAMNIVKKEMMRDLKEFFGGTPEDLIEELIGSDRIKSIRKKQLSKVKEQAKATNVPSPNQVKATPKAEAKPEAPKKVSMRDWLRNSR
jgi:hypothetical protein